MTYTMHMVQHIVLAQLVPIPIAYAATRRSIRAPRPAVGWIIGVAVMIATSVPAAFALAQASAPFEWTMRIALVASGFVFWLPVVGTRTRQLGPAATLAYLVTACFATTLAGVYIAFSATTADQQVAGLLMWVPCCVIYLSASVTVLVRAMGVTSQQVK